MVVVYYHPSIELPWYVSISKVPSANALTQSSPIRCSSQEVVIQVEVCIP